uniref:Uncharacterized protein n=1 Tax=Oryza glumipatula TaxID=40148 RepID=A0A0E0AWT7_9ORYZ
MSRRRKREVAPPPHTSSSYPPGVPTLSAVPYPYGGPWFATPPPAWFASPPSQAMPSSSVCPLPMAAKTNIELQHDFEEWNMLCSECPNHGAALLKGSLYELNLVLGQITYRHILMILFSSL